MDDHVFTCHITQVKQKIHEVLEKKITENKDSKVKNNFWDTGKYKKYVSTQYFHNIKCIWKQIHNGWITKIKFIEDVQSIVSSSLDGMIHYHTLSNLEYKEKEKKTFSLHAKGVNSFVYSAKNWFIASCGEERHIFMWDPFTFWAITKLYGHNTSV